MLRPELLRFGITRVARQTDLDVVGIPCYAAVRPNSRTLAVNQGKGADEAAAQVSAIMEAMEFAVAETPAAARTVASMADLAAAGQAWFIPRRSLPRNYPVDTNIRITWLSGWCLDTQTPVQVPLDSVALAPNAAEALPFSQSSNGLGAGFAESEAIVHALCELIERDASSIWAMRSLGYCAASELDLDSLFDDPDVRRCLDKTKRAGLNVSMFDLTTDLGVPVAMAFLWARSPKGYFDVASGVCAHPSTGRAIAGAIEEAAQTRISNIAGARDDIDPVEYDAPLPKWIAELVSGRRQPRRPPPPSMPETDFADLAKRIGGRTIVIPLHSEGSRVRVVKVISDTLEDKSTNAHWRPGPRAIRAMTGP